MIVIKNVFVYVAVFFVTATTLLCCSFLEPKNASVEETVALSPATEDEAVQEATQKSEVKALQCVKVKEEKKEYIPRFSKPKSSNDYFYSNENPFFESGYGMPNCTCYAWGRAYEITNREPKLALCDAKDWYQYNKENDFYDYGQEPKVGAVACWEYEWGGDGHVAVVEEVEGDIVKYSNSAWGSEEFYITQSSVDNPDMYDGWIFQGYIYLLE